MGALTPLVLVGAGGFARETAEAVRAVNDARPTWDLCGFLDDDPRTWGGQRVGVPVLGPVSLAPDLTDVRLVVCTGSPRDYTSRSRLVASFGLAPERYATVVHPTAVVPRSASLGEGTVLLAGTVLTADVQVGRHVAVMPCCVLTHDDVVSDYATLGAGVRLAGAVRVAEGAYVGSGAMVREGRAVGAWSLVGMGAVVTEDVPPGEVWAGVPARHLRAADVPPALVTTTMGESR